MISTLYKKNENSLFTFFKYSNIYNIEIEIEKDYSKKATKGKKAYQYFPKEIIDEYMYI